MSPNVGITFYKEILLIIFCLLFAIFFIKFKPKEEKKVEVTIQSSTNLEAEKYRKTLIIAKTLYGEARGEGEQGMRHVATVIYNRAKSDTNRFDIECLKKYQFACWNNKTDIEVNKEPKAFEIAFKIASEMISGSFNPISFQKIQNPKFYCTTKLFFSNKIYLNPRLFYIAKVRNSGNYIIFGNHVFYNVIDSPNILIKLCNKILHK